MVLLLVLLDLEAIKLRRRARLMLHKGLSLRDNYSPFSEYSISHILLLQASQIYALIHKYYLVSDRESRKCR